VNFKTIQYTSTLASVKSTFKDETWQYAILSSMDTDRQWPILSCSRMWSNNRDKSWTFFSTHSFSASVKLIKSHAWCWARALPCKNFKKFSHSSTITFWVGLFVKSKFLYAFLDSSLHKKYRVSKSSNSNMTVLSEGNELTKREALWNLSESLKPNAISFYFISSVVNSLYFELLNFFNLPLVTCTSNRRICQTQRN